MKHSAGRGDIFWVDLDPSLGHEQQGRRPCLVLTTEKFNGLTGVPVVLPITTRGLFARKNGFSAELNGGKIQGCVRCDQPSSVDLETRNAQYVETVSEDFMEDVLARVRALFE